MLESKWGLRLVALLLALFMFLSVNDVFEELNLFNGDEETAETEVIQDVPVESLYSDELYVSGAPSYVNVQLSGATSNMTRLQTTQDFEVYLDLRDKEVGEHEVSFTVQGLPDNVTAEVIPQTATVNIQEMVERTFEVQAEINESRIGPNHQLDTVNIDPETVTVRGGEDEVNRIQYVRATLSDNSRITEDREEDAEINVFDFQFNRLDVETDPSSVNVEVLVDELSKSVPVSHDTVGSVDSEYELSNIELNYEEVEVFGPQEVLDEINSIDVEVDVDDMTQSETRDIEMDLPEGVTNTEPAVLEAEITVEDSE